MIDKVEKGYGSVAATNQINENREEEYLPEVNLSTIC
jgi:hypothetical protein